MHLLLWNIFKMSNFLEKNYELHMLEIKVSLIFLKNRILIMISLLINEEI